MKEKRLIIKIPSRCIFNLSSFDFLNGFGGGYGVSLDTNSYLIINLSTDKNVIFPEEYSNLISYYISIFQQKIHKDDFFNVQLVFDSRIQCHSGFGSNMMVACAIIYALNIMYCEPFSIDECIDMIKKYYIEKDEDPEFDNFICTSNALYMIFLGGLCIVDKYKSLYFRKEISSKMFCFIIKTNNRWKNINRKDLLSKAVADDNKFDLEREKIILHKLPKFIEEDNYQELAYYTQYIQNRGGQKIYREYMESPLCSLDEVIKLFENKKMVTGFNNGSNIYVFTKEFDEVKKICKKYSLNYDVFSVDNQGLCCIEQQINL